jgi:hypothetical protein
LRTGYSIYLPFVLLLKTGYSIYLPFVNWIICSFGV